MEEEGSCSTSPISKRAKIGKEDITWTLHSSLGSIEGFIVTNSHLLSGVH
jgi:hypothetical protein